MNSELAPIAFGSGTLDITTLSISAIVVAVAVAFLLGARQETAMFAVFAGIVGVILSL